MEIPEDQKADRLNELFDALVAGEHLGDVDPVMFESVQRFFDSDDAPAMTEDKTTEILEEVMNRNAISATIPWQTSTPWQVSSNNHVVARTGHWRTRPGDTGLGSWQMRAAYFAIAVTLLVALAGGFFAVGQFRSGSDDPQTVPAAIAPAATPASIAATPVGSATVIVKLINDEGDPYPNGCYGSVVVHESGQLEFLEASRCDADDGAADGSIALTIPAGREIVVYPTSWPSTSHMTSSQVVNAEPGETLNYTFQAGQILILPIRPSDLSIKEGSGIDPEVSVCYALFNASGDGLGPLLTYACDSPTADKPRKGETRFEDLVPGSYLVVRIDENGQPIGDPVPVTTVDGGAALTITWPDE